MLPTHPVPVFTIPVEFRKRDAAGFVLFPVYAIFAKITFARTGRIPETRNRIVQGIRAVLTQNKKFSHEKTIPNPVCRSPVLSDIQGDRRLHQLHHHPGSLLGRLGDGLPTPPTPTRLYGALYKTFAGRYKPGTMLPVYDWDSGRYLGEIPQAAQTYATIGNMNEHSLIIAESTYGGREEAGRFDGPHRLRLAHLHHPLQRAKTAREAIRIIVDLANTYGYASSGESFSIADRNEAWIMEADRQGLRDSMPRVTTPARASSG